MRYSKKRTNFPSTPTLTKADTVKTLPAYNYLSRKQAPLGSQATSARSPSNPIRQRESGGARPGRPGCRTQSRERARSSRYYTRCVFPSDAPTGFLLKSFVIRAAPRDQNEKAPAGSLFFQADCARPAISGAAGVLPTERRLFAKQRAAEFRPGAQDGPLFFSRFAQRDAPDTKRAAPARPGVFALVKIDKATRPARAKG